MDGDGLARGDRVHGGDGSLRVGVYHWAAGDGFAREVLGTLRDLGHDAVPILPGSEEQLSRLDVLLLYGPWGSLETLFRALRAMPRELRPVTLLWQGEQFPDPRLPSAVWWLVGVARSYFETFAHLPVLARTPRVHRALTWLTGRLHRFRYYGDIWRYRRAGLLDVLAVWSPRVGEELTRRGLAPMVVGMGYYPDCGRDLGLVRDIDVVWLGKAGSRRRQRLVRRVRRELTRRGVRLLVVDGVEHRYVFGEERTRLLNRTKIVLNLLRQTWDDNSMRFFFAAANGALVVSEPTLRHSDFTAGVHLVEAPLDRLADAVQAYLQDEPAREAIVVRARKLAVETLTMRATVRRLLEAAQRARSARATAGGPAPENIPMAAATASGSRSKPVSHARSSRSKQPRTGKAGEPADLRRNSGR
jgi:hypothetical protein